MIIAIIILSILLFISIIFNILYKIFFKELSIKVKNFKNMIDQFTGNIPKEEIDKEYKNINLFFNIDKSFDNACYQIYDTSLLDEKQIIGLTYLVQEQEYNEFKKEAYKRLNEAGVSFEDFQIWWDNPEIIPGVTIYRMKDGKWLWVQ